MTDMDWIDEILGKNWMAVPPEKRPKDYVEGTYTWQGDAIRAHLIAEKRELIESIRQSVMSHTVPEGRGLMTKSYLYNTLDFELGKLAK